MATDADCPAVAVAAVAAVAVAALVAVAAVLLFIVIFYQFDSPVKSQVSSEGFGRHLPLSVISSSNKAC